MICLHCAHFNMKKHPEHAKTGYGTCILIREVGQFVSVKHQCKKFSQATEDVIAKRDEWAKKNGIKNGIK